MRTPFSVVLLTTSRYISTLSTAHLNFNINSHIHNGNLKYARQLFDHNSTSQNVVSWNSMVAGYIKHDQMKDARDLFDQMPVRDAVSWNTVLSGLLKIRDTKGVYHCFLQMRRDGLTPNEFTFPVVISAVLHTAFNALIPQFHGLIFCLALNSSVFVGSALIRGYTDLRDRQGLCQVFDEILAKDVTSWNALILGYMELGLTVEAQKAFDKMPEKNIVSWTTLVHGYITKKKIYKAWSLFNKMSERNVVLWTAMISGYVQNEKFKDGLGVYFSMLKSGSRPNHFTFSSVLDACAGCSSLLVGIQVHSTILKSGMPLDVILSTSLVDMYAKCGDIEAAFCIFDSIPKKNLVSWNSIIGGYARHGLATRALEEFERMTKGGTRPDQITFVNVLSACGRGGLVEDGERYFNSMGTKYGIEAGMEHYACMVDLYGRAGQLEKAEKLIKGMPFEPDVVVWGALLGACVLHSSLEIGEFAAEGIYNLEKSHPAVYTMLSKIHGEKGAWGSVIELKNMVKEMRAKKQKAGSWIESTFVNDGKTSLGTTYWPS
ncbi:pentatricopeptide repeat-containing protein At4g02750-like [Cornus florida]|uniref:pentatricopeptide repeat-containing protein At4g02750-like n=1 Tax=Cornus florida TaxID=4283 RepID=UPI00289C7904|nr:pentatricopeptide repeat-containing protein At4g02750-like [Cornus florida]